MQGSIDVTAPCADRSLSLAKRRNHADHIDALNEIPTVPSTTHAMAAPLTKSELAFEQWCQLRGVEHRRIREAVTPGHKRPDYAIKFQQLWCIVEIKELAQTPDDAETLSDLQSGKPRHHWVSPGARIRQSIKDSASQLRKFSHRGFPTVACLFDTTVGFHLEQIHVVQAMLGLETLHFEVSPDSAHEPRFVGMRHGKKATLTTQNNTSISAVATLRRSAEHSLVIDLHHNPHARVPIARGICAPLVRKQYPEERDDPNEREPTVLDLMKTPEWDEWLADPEGKCDREIEKCLREFRAAGKESDAS